jgi:hypothetical protein
MAVFKRGGVGALAGIAALAVVALSSGCDWLKGSDLIRRTSPFLSGLSLPGTALCGEEFLVGFTFDDPQGDVFSVHLLAVHEEEGATRESSLLWDDTFDRGNASVTYPFTFTEGAPGGTWTITVTVEDDLGHESNALSGTILLGGDC